MSIAYNAVARKSSGSGKSGQTRIRTTTAMQSYAFDSEPSISHGGGQPVGRKLSTQAYSHGNICLDILQDNWSSAYDVRTILLSIQSLLGEPNNDSPLNTQAAALWANQEEFRKMVEKFYKPAA